MKRAWSTPVTRKLGSGSLCARPHQALALNTDPNARLLASSTGCPEPLAEAILRQFGSLAGVVRASVPELQRAGLPLSAIQHIQTSETVRRRVQQQRPAR